MSKIKLISTIAATTLLVSAAQAAPKTPTKTATPDHTQITCQVTVKDVNGKTIGRRVMTDERSGVVARVKTPQRAPGALIFTIYQP